MEKVNELSTLKGSEIRVAKEVLAYEATKLCHGQGEADSARDASHQLFGTGKSPQSDSVPSYNIDAVQLEQGIPAYILFEKSGLCKTRGEARRLISQGGGYANNARIQAFDQIIDRNDLVDDAILLRAGKKKYLRVTTV